MNEGYSIQRRRLSRRRLLQGAGGLAGGAAFGALLAACGGGKPAASGGAAPAPAANANPVDAVDLTGKRVQISFWHHLTGANADSFNAIAEAFNSSQSLVTIQPENQGATYDALYKKLITAAAGGGLPDLAEAYPNQVSDYQGGNAVAVLDDTSTAPSTV